MLEKGKKGSSKMLEDSLYMHNQFIHVYRQETEGSIQVMTPNVTEEKVNQKA